MVIKKIGRRPKRYQLSIGTYGMGVYGEYISRGSKGSKGEHLEINHNEEGIIRIIRLGPNSIKVIPQSS